MVMQGTFEHRILIIPHITNLVVIGESCDIKTASGAVIFPQFSPPVETRM